MTYSVDSPIVHAPTGTLAEALAWLDIKAGAETEYATELWRLCALVGIDPALLFAQAAHETADFSSVWWLNRRNPAGLGITGDPEQNADSQIWKNGTDAARGHVVHMAVYVGQGTRNLWDYWELDQRRDDALDAGYFAIARTLADLTGKWATDPRYAEKIAAKANAIFPNRQETQPVTTPVIYDLARDYARFGLSNDEAREVLSHRFDNRSGVPKPTFIVLHIQAGNTRGSLAYWAGREGTEIQASSTVMIQHDGSILNVIPEQHAPWTNGDDAQPSANGARLVNLPGNSNLYTLSIEAEGVDGGDTTDAQLDSIVWQVETWMAKYVIPKENVLRHADINSVTRPNCPGAYYPKVMTRIKDNIGDIPEKPKPTVPWDHTDIGPQRMPNGRVALAFVGEVHAKRNVPIRYTVGTGKAKPEDVYVSLEKGKSAIIRGSYRSETGAKWAFIEVDGGVGRAPLSAFTGPWPTT